MKKKYIALIAVAIIISSLGILEYTQGTVSALVLDQMTYSYSSHVIIPSLASNQSATGGYYAINGSGRNFKMLMVLPSAEKTESPLDYTSDGLHITGTIDTIKATPQTVLYLLQKNLLGAMFNTVFTGHMNMTCAAWTGTSKFQNDGKHFTGTFQITGVYTDWNGNYTLAQGSNGIEITSDYILYPKNQSQNNIALHSIYYL